MTFTTIHDIPAGGYIQIERESHEFGIPRESQFDCSARGVPQANPNCE